MTRRIPTWTSPTPLSARDLEKMLMTELMNLKELLKENEQEKLEEFQRLERIKQTLEWQTEGTSVSASEGEVERQRQEMNIVQSPTLGKDPTGDKYNEPLKQGLTQKLMDDYDLMNLLGAEGQELVKWHLKDRLGMHRDHAGK